MGPKTGQDGCGKSHPHRDFFLVLSSYFIRICFFVRIVLVFAFCPYCAAQISMPPAGFKPAIPAGERPKPYTLEGAPTGIGGFQSADPPVRSESLYRLSSPGPQNDTSTTDTVHASTRYALQRHSSTRTAGAVSHLQNPTTTATCSTC